MCHMEHPPTNVHRGQKGSGAQKGSTPCISTCSQRQTGTQRDIYEHTSTHFFNLRQHEFTVVLAGLSFSVCDVFSHSLTGGHHRRSSSLLKEGVRGEHESPLSSWFAITGSAFFKSQRGSRWLLFISRQQQGGWGKTQAVTSSVLALLRAIPWTREIRCTVDFIAGLVFGVCFFFLCLARMDQFSQTNSFKPTPCVVILEIHPLIEECG